MNAVKKWRKWAQSLALHTSASYLIRNENFNWFDIVYQAQTMQTLCENVRICVFSVDARTSHRNSDCPILPREDSNWFRIRFLRILFWIRKQSHKGHALCLHVFLFPFKKKFHEFAANKEKEHTRQTKLASSDENSKQFT